jgi:hypothetical protein
MPLLVHVRLFLQSRNRKKYKATYVQLISNWKFIVFNVKDNTLNFTACIFDRKILGPRGKKTGTRKSPLLLRQRSKRENL